MRAHRLTGLMACALVIACSHESSGAETLGGGAIDTLGGSTGAGDSDPDGGDSAGEGTPLDLGSADDGGAPEVGGCEEEVPLAFDIPTDPSCQTEPQVGMFTPVVEWTKREWVDNPTSQESVTTPIVVQLTDDDNDGSIDDDDIPDIAYVTYNNGGMLRAISGDGSGEVLSVAGSGFGRQTGIAAADIDLDGIVEIIGINDNKNVIAFEHDGTVKWTSASLAGHAATHDNSAAISDMNGDGVPEIVAGRAILDAQGNILAAGTHGTGSAGAAGSLSFAVDLNDDGQQEVVVGNAVYRMDGTDVWFNGENDGFPAVADLDGNGTPEIVVVNAGTVRLQSAQNGAVLWSTSVPGGNGGPPTVADFDGDGAAEIGVAGASTYTVFEGDGTQLWSNVTQDLSSGITGSSVYDFEGDGVADVVYADETKLWVYSGHDGSVKLEFDEHSSGTRIEYPIIADVDGDGEVEIAYVNENYQADYRGLTVIGDANHTWRPGRKIWNQHAYHITNVGDGGQVPAAASQNWKSFNSFRSGDLSPNDGLAIPGLELHAPDPCAELCDAGMRTVFVQLGNGGAAELTSGAEIEVYGVAGGVETLLEVIPYALGLPAGKVTDGIAVEIDALQYDQVLFRATANEILCGATEASIVVDLPACPEAPPAAG